MKHKKHFVVKHISMVEITYESLQKTYSTQVYPKKPNSMNIDLKSKLDLVKLLFFVVHMIINVLNSRAHKFCLNLIYKESLY